jgi:peroxiredoxin
MRSSRSTILLFLLSFLIAAPSAHAADTGPEVGKLAPSFELRDLAGKTVSLSDFKGKVVLLNFWSTLCAPCTAELPSLNRLAAAVTAGDFIVVAVAIDASEKPVREFLSGKSFAFTVLLDPEKEVFFDQYAGPSLPASYLIDRNGIIVDKFSGPREWGSPDMKNRVVKLLEKR